MINYISDYVYTLPLLPMLFALPVIQLLFTYTNNISYLLVLLKALPPVCMKYAARGESRVTNIARGKAVCYICHKTLTKSCLFHMYIHGSALGVL